MVPRLAGWALRSGIRRGVVGGSNAWLIVAVAAGAYKLLTRASKPEVATLRLKPGERYSITCGD